jgi:hypothetical protein
VERQSINLGRSSAAAARLGSFSLPTISFLSYSDTRLQSVVFLEESFSFQVFILKLSLLIIHKFAVLLILVQILTPPLPAASFTFLSSD